MADAWFLAGVPKGSRATREHEVLQYSDGSRLLLRCIVSRGASDGPVLYVGAAMHGDEVVGIAVIRELLRQVDPSEMRGSLVLVPVQNPPAFMARQRFVPGHAFDTFTVDLAGAFFRREPGEVTEAIAASLVDSFVGLADAAVDLHAALAGGENLDYCFSPSGDAPAFVEARNLARLMRFPMVMEQRVGSYVGPTKLIQVATSQNVPTFCVEMHEAGRVTPRSVDRCVSGILNVMRHLGMVEGPVLRAPAKQYLARDAVFVRSPGGGLYEPTMDLGAEVKAGDTLGVLYSPDLSVETPIVSPVEGVLYRRAHYRPVHGTERVASIGVRGVSL